MLNDTDQWLGVEQLPRFKDPLTALLWGSRIYLVHASSGEPDPPALHLLFSKVLCSATEASLQQVLDFMMFHSTIPLAVHALDCECVSAHEQALADAIRAVQAGSLEGYQNAMAGVLRAASDAAEDAEGKVAALLEISDVFGSDLPQSDLFRAAVTNAYERLSSQGAAASVACPKRSKPPQKMASAE